MDTSEQNIRMCEKAKKIQDLWEFTDGDFYYAISVSNNVVTTLCEHCNVKDSFGDTYINEYSRQKYIWLPSQSQLQEMVEDSLDDLIFGFMCFCYQPVGGGCFEGRTTYTEQFKSMEQLWLAFVMKEKFGKVWTGDEWK